LSGAYHPRDFAGNVHVALMGDPSLRMHPVIPPSNARAVDLPAGVQLAWAPSTDSGIAGYHVYRAAAAAGPYKRLTSNPVLIPAFVDFSSASESFYQVRAVKLESSASGTYYNQSQGIFTVKTKPAVDPELIPLSARPGADKTISIRFPSVIGNTYALLASQDFVTWTKAAEKTAAALETSIDAPQTGEFKFYRITLIR
jgi:hypothetical protein